MDNDLEPPKPSAGDRMHAAGRLGLSFIPCWGGPAVELFGLIVTPPLERRRNEWMQRVGERLTELTSKGVVSVDQLSQDEGFIDTLLQSTRVAMQNSAEEKRQALLNAVVNTALPCPPEDSLREIFIGYLDIFTVWHLRLLRLLDNPQRALTPEQARQCQEMAPSLDWVVEYAFPEMRGNRGFYDVVWADLWTKCLLNTQSLHAMMTRSGLLVQRTTPMGRALVEFITEPSAEPPGGAAG